MILPFVKLSETGAGIRGWGERIVHAHGCFDMLHVNHVRHLQAAKKLGNYLVVTVTPDRFVNKGPGRPLIPEAERVEMLAALECVDYVALNEYPTAVEAIALLRPTVYVKGAEYRGKTTDLLAEEIEALKAVNGELVYTPAAKGPTTTEILRQIMRRMNEG